MKPSRVLGAVCALALVASACSSSTESSSNSSSQWSAASAPSESVAPIGDIEWLPCGAVQCGSLSVLADTEAPQLGSVKLALYRRVSPLSSKAPVLLLVADRVLGVSPRELAEQAPLLFGSSVNGYTVVSVASRGMVESPMPVAASSRIATLDVAEDLQFIYSALNTKKVFAMGWGSGATAVVAWEMQYPKSVDAAVVDAPMDPAAPLPGQLTEQLVSTERAGVTAARWCASHLSCSINAIVADEIARFRLKMLEGRLPEGITADVVSRAAANAIASASPGKIFDAMLRAMDNRDGIGLLQMAGVAPAPADATAFCADVPRNVAARATRAAVALHSKHTRQIHVGNEHVMWGFCADLPEAARPLGAVQPAESSTGARMMVTIARGDPFTPPAPARAMTKRMKWTYLSVAANRRFVLGVDTALTEAAMEFLGA
jgi:pimeloyl-ACP methyl ester carboxylesterase